MHNHILEAHSQSKQLQKQGPLQMSSFFSKFRPSKPSKKKAQTNQQTPYSSGPYQSSNNSSQASLATKSHASSQPGRGFAPGFAPGGNASTSSLQQSFHNNGTASKHSSASYSYVQQPGSHQQPSQLPLFLCQPFNRAALVKGSFQTIVELPKYVDKNEWLALNMFEFNNCVNQFVNVLSDYINESHIMSGGPGYDYLWIDTNKQAIRLAASTYIDNTLTWIAAKFDDPSLFPTRQGVPFPPNFFSVVQSIYTQLFRIFAYLFHNQYDKIVHLSLEPHFNSLFCHFASFGKTFNLLDRNEIAPLTPLIQNFESQGKIA